MSISKFVMVGAVKTVGATARGACSVAYAAGNDISIGFDAACKETERQVEMTKAHVAQLQDARARKLAVAQQLREQMAVQQTAKMAAVAA